MKNKKSPSVQVICRLITANGYIPNNPRLPLLIYQQVFPTPLSAEKIQSVLEENHWINSWVDGIYDYHHYHSNTHETLVVLSGRCTVQMGGYQGDCYDIAAGDVIIIPAGVAHKNLDSSSDFRCVGAYPFDLEYDMNRGDADDHPRVDKNIATTGLPYADPIFGAEGILFDYWK